MPKAVRSATIATNSRTIRLPSHITEKLNKIKKTQRQLSQKLGRTPSVDELATELKLTPKQVRKCCEHTKKSISLNQLVGECLDTELTELLEDTQECPSEFATQSALSDDLEQLIADLTTQQREVIRLRFGLADGQFKTLAEVGKQLHLSRERVRQVEN